MNIRKLAITCVSGLIAGVALANEAKELSRVSMTSVTFDKREYRFDPAKAECIDIGGHRMTCATLVGIGYADLARIWVSDGNVTRIQLMKLSQ